MTRYDELFEKALKNINHPFIQKMEELDETVRTAFKMHDMDTRVFQAKLKKFGQAADYRIMMQNFKKHSNVGDGLYFTDTSKGLGFEIHSVRDRMMGDKIKKLGDSQGNVTLIAIKEDVQLDEGTMNFLFDSPMKAGAFAKRVMRDKLASEVDRYVDHGKRKEVVELITHPNNYEKNDILKLAKQYKGTVHSVNEEFRFPQPGEDYGELTKSISGTGPSMSDLKKKSAEIRRKFAAAMRKHKGTKVGEVLDLLDKKGERQVYQDSDIKQISKYLSKHKDNVRKVANQMLTDLMMGDNYLANKRIPVKEDVQIKEAESLHWDTMKDTEKEELVRLAKVPARATEMEWKKIPAPIKSKLGKYINKSTKGEFALVEERSNTIVVDRKTGKTVFGPTELSDAKRYLEKQIQPRKFVIRQIRGRAATQR